MLESYGAARAWEAQPPRKPGCWQAKSMPQRLMLDSCAVHDLIYMLAAHAKPFQYNPQ